MSAWRNHPLFLATLLVLGATTAGEAWCLSARARAARRAVARLEQHRREWRALDALAIAPSPENAALLAEDCGRAQQIISMLESELLGSAPKDLSPTPAVAPRLSTEVYFELATFVARMRQRAAQLGVEVAPNEQFGFAKFAQAGPAAEQVDEVRQACAATQRLLEMLFAANPARLVSVERDGGETEAAVGEPFHFDFHRSIRAQGILDAAAIRLIFDGRTTALRGFLTRMARSERPFAVRGVEVMPLDSEEETRRQQEAAADPFLRATISRFVVTVEAILPVSGTGPTT